MSGGAPAARRHSFLFTALALLACASPTLASAQLPPDPIGVEALPAQPGPHWVWVNDIAFFAFPDGKAFLVDGDSGRMLGMLSTGFSFNAVVIPKSGDVIYAPETYFSRGSRGKRTDVVTLYDARRLAPIAEIPIPAKRASQMAMLSAAALTDDDRFLLIYNFTPAQSVTVVDTKSRKFLGEVQIAGCALVYPLGPRSFFSICGDGALLVVTSLTDAGTVARRARTAAMIDVNKDPVTEKGVRLGDTWLFASFEGVVHSLRAIPSGIQFDPTWPLFTPLELSQHWRTGGLQHLALHASSKRLFAIVHQGGTETHKELGNQIWVYDLSTHRKVQTIMTRTKVGSIQVSPDAQPLLFACSLDSNHLDVYDATSGKFLRTVDSLGQTPSVLVNLQGAP